ncbi:hypothetical protein PFISCL1PPCAC_16583 [Pristionchus fissidentatus]|uniref:Nhr-66 n=1 Tax=Pristionchus fissidentatus TaxID=1538716 RepID=A0AAV5W0D9_9BILA|nr:hypothetical protein PFISCL1PPCAC_16583 [Pristionchus fissidentatus]
MLLGSISGLPLDLPTALLLKLPATPVSPQNTSFSSATNSSSGVSSLASAHSAAAAAVAAVAAAAAGSPPTAVTPLMASTLRAAMIANGDIEPKMEPRSNEGSETGLDFNGRPPVPLCAICSADSTGIHFGVEACAACSAFFRRTVVLAKNYECTKGGECVTHKDTSGSARCRACRFKKCITVGMDRGAVQHRRDAIGKVSQIKKEEQSPPGGEEEMDTKQNVNSYHHLMLPSTSKPEPKMNVLEDWVDRHYKLSRKRKLFYTLTTLTDAFEDTSPTQNQPPTEMRNFSECMYQLWRIEPRLVAEYVNENPVIMHLKANEKAALFRNFMLAFQGVEEPYLTWLYGGTDGNMWVMPNRQFLNFEHINMYFATNIMSGLNLDMSTAVRIFLPSFAHAMEIVGKPMSKLSITQNEMIALSGIMYLDPMAPGLSEETRAYLMKARGDLISSILQYYYDVLSKELRFEDPPEVRLSVLLNISAGIKIHAEKTRENMQIMSLFEVIPCDNLFNEMCNIETAYSDEARSRLRERAILEDLVPKVKIEASDIKWEEYKRQIRTGMIAKGAHMSAMIGADKEARMTVPVLETESPMSMLAKLNAQKKEEPEDDYKPGPSIRLPPGVQVTLPQPSPVSAFATPVSAAAAAAAAVATSLAAAAAASSSSFVVPSPPAITSAAPVVQQQQQLTPDQQLIARIMANQKRDHAILQMQNERLAHGIRPIDRAQEYLQLTQMTAGLERNDQLEKRKGVQDPVKEAVAAAKRARVSFVDAGTDPATPPNPNAAIFAAAVAATAAAAVSASAAASAAASMPLAVAAPLDALPSITSPYSSMFNSLQQRALAQQNIHAHHQQMQLQQSTQLHNQQLLQALLQQQFPNLPNLPQLPF